ncbi:hypothetical protein RGQ29_005414 [Quercus rubra]|uniref:Uncharacterized protein n=1 Tax=Quercus rubra TaxID=3512 RepID=A0AAN7I7F2_QUERU|nr:hypothetical protein RGQ29_005414 [Quercus rubra]
MIALTSTSLPTKTSDLDLLQFSRLQVSDKHSNCIFRVVGKYFPGCTLPNLGLDPLQKTIMCKLTQEVTFYG